MTTAIEKPRQRLSDSHDHHIPVGKPYTEINGFTDSQRIPLVPIHPILLFHHPLYRAESALPQR
jgi:hypothetical protein